MTRLTVLVLISLTIALPPAVSQQTEPTIFLESFSILVSGMTIKATVKPDSVRVRQFAFDIDGRRQDCSNASGECTVTLAPGLDEVTITVYAYLVGREAPLVLSTRSRRSETVEVRSVLLWGRVFQENRTVPVDHTQLRVFDNGVPVNADCDRRLGALHVVLAVDGSGSMKRHLLALRQQLGRFLTKLEPTDSVTLLNFDQSVKDLTVSATPSIAGARLIELRSGGQTALWDALLTSARKFGPGSGNFLFLLTDGDDQVSVQQPSTVERMLSRTDAVLFVNLLPGAGISTKTKGHLREMAKHTSGEYREIRSIATLGDQLSTELADGRAMYVCAFDRPGEADGLWHELSVQVLGRPELQPNFRPRYLSEKR